MLKRSTSSVSSFVIIFVLGGLLVVSTLFNIQCSQQQQAIVIMTTTTTKTTKTDLLTTKQTDSTRGGKEKRQREQQDEDRSSSLSSFEKTIQIAQSIIHDDLPPPPPNDTPRNTDDEFDLEKWDELRTTGGLQDLDRIKLAEIYSHADSVFEYGLGESTYIANAVHVRRYVGVDSDANWVATARDTVQNDQYRFYFADVGKTGSWGYPLRRKHIPAKSIYQYQIMPLMAELSAFDVYMSDGRWRIPCMIASFLHASARGANTNHTIVLLHDCLRQEYWDNGSGKPIPDHVNLRLGYQVADHLLDLVDHSGDRLCVYKRKSNTTDEQLLQFWEEHYTLIE